MKREWLMLAQVYERFVSGVLISEKLDGVRAFWDGGVSRGKSFVPYSNDSRVATGLWSRYGNVLSAPDWWLDKLPPFPLDGELWMGRGRFQDTVSTVRKHIPGDWSGVTYQVFDSPPMQAVLEEGQINNVNDKRYITSSMYDWWRNNGGQSLVPYGTPYVETYRKLQEHGLGIEQTECWLSKEFDKALNEAPDNVEGLMIRFPNACWTPKRVPTLLKAKRLRSGVAVVNYVTGGKGKHLGRIGSINVTDGSTFDISGFTDAERTVPEMLVPGLRYNYHTGRTMAYTYRELTDDGKPKEARFEKWLS